MTSAPPGASLSRRDLGMLATGLGVALVTFAAWTLLPHSTTDGPPAKTAPNEQTAETSADDFKVNADVLKAAAIAYATVTEGPRVERVAAAGTVQANELEMQDVTPLVSGRIERLAVVEGTVVQAGAVILTMSSPEIAELQGAHRAAEAKLTEAQAALTRTQRLVDLGAGAGKDLVAAEASHRAAQAEETQLRERLEALGGTTGAAASGVVARTSIRAPATATVIERHVNPGQWIAAGAVVAKLANLSTVWVMASVPEGRLPAIQVGAPADIRVAALDNAVINGRVTYIEKELDAETRTAPVRIEVPNPGQRLRIGMFAEVTIQGRRLEGAQLLIPTSAVQRIGDRRVVFVPLKDEGTFQVRDVELAEETQGMRAVRSGLKVGERVVSNGGFTLKSQLLKGQFGEDEELGGKEP